ncbi:hypothetical protein Tco_0349353, partial [Tanacetum coccineum]
CNLLGLIRGRTGHNLFSVGQFFDLDLEVAFRKILVMFVTRLVLNYLKDSRGSYLYTIAVRNDEVLPNLLDIQTIPPTHKSCYRHRRLPLELRFIHTDIGTEFVNKTLYDYYEALDLSPRQVPRNSTAERRCRIDGTELLSRVIILEKIQPRKILEFSIGYARAERTVLTPVDGLLIPATFVMCLPQNPTYEASSSREIMMPEKSTKSTQPYEYIRKWTNSHPLDNIIGNHSRLVSTRKQLAMDALWCFYNSVLSKVEPKNFKSAVTEDCWFQAMQDEIHEFDRLDVWELVPPPDCAMIIALK